MNIIRPKIVGGVTIIVITILLISLAQEMNRRIHVQREVERLEQEVQSMERSVVELQNLNTYFNTDAYQERLAREKLNFQLPGEKVVLIPDDAGSSGEPASKTAETPRTISIPERWWRVFFVPKSIDAT